jgi:23S rRNA (guanine745-N1)-methyltransferase
VGCDGGHRFDVAREGYVNLLLPQHRRSRDPGYSREMIAARREFLDAGHYQRLADTMADLVAAHLPTPRSVVLDAGCGEGYYLRRLRARCPDTLLFGLDVSKHAIRAAARADPAGRYAVARTHGMPVADGGVCVLLAHFSPVSPDDFARVVRPGGTVLVGGPGPDHLASLKRLIYEHPRPHPPADPLADAAGFQPAGTCRISYLLALRGPGQVANLLAMTPYGWTVDQPTRDRLAALEQLDTQVDVLVHAYRRVST